MQINLTHKFCFRIKGKNLSLLVGNPGKKINRTEAEIVIKPNDDDKVFIRRKKDESFLITAPGEYEISGVSVFGISNVYVVEMDEIRLCYLHKLNSDLTDEQLEEADGADILLLAIGKPDFDINQAIKTINKIQPKLVLIGEVKIKDEFLKQLGYEEPKEEKRLIISKADLPEEMEVVVLKAQDG